MFDPKTDDGKDLANQIGWRCEFRIQAPTLSDALDYLAGFPYNFTDIDSTLYWAFEVGERDKEMIHDPISISDLHARLSILLPIAINFNIHTRANTICLEENQILIYNDLVNMMGFQSRHRLTDSTKRGCWFHIENPSISANVSDIILPNPDDVEDIHFRVRRGQWTDEKSTILYELVRSLIGKRNRINWSDTYALDIEFINNNTPLQCNFPIFEGKLLGLQSYKDRYKLLRKEVLNAEEKLREGL